MTSFIFSETLLDLKPTTLETTMRFLMTYASLPNAAPPTPEQMAKIGAFSQRMAEAGVLVMSGGLVRPTRGIQIRCEDGDVSVTDGPFAESKELIDGFALVQVSSKEEAIAVAREFMQVAGDGMGEILQVFEPGGPPR